jgi:porphobilinogen synthase
MRWWTSSPPATWSRKAGNTVAFPINRLRRTRRTAGLRGLVRETELSPSDFIYPIFVIAGEDVRNPIASMPGIFQLSINHAVEEVRRVHALGIPGVLLFGIPDEKDEAASGAYDPEGVVQLATLAIKDALPELLVVTDVCLCEYMSHGHCGVVDRERGEILNDVSVELLARTASSQAEAGADIVAPSDMMDGRVAALRSELDREGHEGVPIMAYSAKYASAFYGPFREAAESAPQFGDRRGYQMDPANVREALREVALDVEEGADIVMVKPALPYLDVVRRVRETTDLPVAAYNVSGEYSMLKAAAQNGWLDEERAVLEALTGIKRAGAEIIISYHAPDVARWLQ